MAYSKNLEDAANRHYNDGRKLAAAKRFDNAGYHFGLAAECAIKHELMQCGVRADEDAIWRHWPDLKPLALLSISGRRASRVRALLERENFMQWWEIVMRYSPTGEVDERKATKWADDANEALGLLL